MFGEIQPAVKKETKKVDRGIHYDREVKKLEKKIAEKEKELEALRELRFDPEYYHDYQKMRDLDDKIDDVHNEIENFMKKWEDYSEKLEQ